MSGVGNLSKHEVKVLILRTGTEKPEWGWEEDHGWLLDSPSNESSRRPLCCINGSYSSAHLLVRDI